MIYGYSLDGKVRGDVKVIHSIVSAPMGLSESDVNKRISSFKRAFNNVNFKLK